MEIKHSQVLTITCFILKLQFNCILCDHHEFEKNETKRNRQKQDGLGSDHGTKAIYIYTPVYTLVNEMQNMNGNRWTASRQAMMSGDSMVQRHQHPT